MKINQVGGYGQSILFGGFFNFPLSKGFKTDLDMGGFFHLVRRLPNYFKGIAVDYPLTPVANIRNTVPIFIGFNLIALFVASKEPINVRHIPAEANPGVFVTFFMLNLLFNFGHFRYPLFMSLSYTHSIA